MTDEKTERLWQDFAFHMAALKLYMRTGKHKPGLSRKEQRACLMQCQTHVLRDDVLYYHGPKGEGLEREVITSKERKNRIIHQKHTGSKGGHIGVTTTISNITQQYWWKGIRNDVQQFISTCASCQGIEMVKPEMVKPQAPILKPIVVEETLDLVGIGLIGPLPETPQGHRYVLTMTDYFTKWVDMFPLKKKEATGVCSAIYTFITRWGPPKQMLFDQGKEFVNKLNQELCSKLAIQGLVTPAYHPQCNGLDERTSQTVKTRLSKLVHPGAPWWDTFLDEVAYSICTQRQASTKFSPYYMMFGRTPQRILQVMMETEKVLGFYDTKEEPALAAVKSEMETDTGVVKHLPMSGYESKCHSADEPAVKTEVKVEIDVAEDLSLNSGMTKAEQHTPGQAEERGTGDDSDRKFGLGSSEDDEPPGTFETGPGESDTGTAKDRRMALKERDTGDELLVKFELESDTSTDKDRKMARKERDTGDDSDRKFGVSSSEVDELLVKFEMDPESDKGTAKDRKMARKEKDTGGGSDRKFGLGSSEDDELPVKFEPQSDTGRTKYRRKARMRDKDCVTRKEASIRTKPASHSPAVISTDSCVGLKQDAADQSTEATDINPHSEEHTLIPRGEKPHKCHQCRAAFTQSGSLKRHILIHTGEKPHKCLPCGAAFRESGALKKHMMIHTGEKPHKCLQCASAFRLSDSLKKHALVHTGEKPHKCLQCGDAFGRNDTLQYHMRMHTGTKDRKCAKCGVAFKLSSDLKKHMLIHAGEKPHKCVQCDAAFRWSGDLTRHILIHTGEKPHKCLHCGDSFSFSGNLNKHMLIHTGAKPHQCSLCGVTFRISGHLKTHMLIHTGEKPHRCAQCTAAFRHACQLKRHMLNHTAEQLQN